MCQAAAEAARTHAVTSGDGVIEDSAVRHCVCRGVEEHHGMVPKKMMEKQLWIEVARKRRR